MKKVLLSLTVILFHVFAASSQTNNEASSTTINSLTTSNELMIPKKNNVKLSLTSLVFKNFQFQYERSLTKRIGVVVGYSFISKGSVPFKSQINELTTSGSDTQDMFSNAELGYSAITPEVRFYLGKGYGKGFYIAPFYRHLKYDITDINFTYDTNLLGGQADINLGGKLSADTFGLQFGAQFNLGKHLILDWWIAGPHYGTAKGDFVGIADRQLNSFEQAQLQKELDKIELPLSDVKATVNANGANIKVSGPWGGIRSGLSLGYRF